MKKSKIKLNFTQLRDAELEASSFAIAAAMSGNPHFPEPIPTLADLNTSIQLFADSLAAAKTGDRVKTIQKKQLRTELDHSLTQLAHYCSFVAKGDRYVLASSGFALTTQQRNTKPLGNALQFTVEVGRVPGAALIYLQPVSNAKAYLFRWAPAPVENDFWWHTIDSQPRFTITGLVPGNTYSFQIIVAGSKGQKQSTSVISRMVV